MVWIFPRVQKKMLQIYRSFLRWLFWGLSLKLKQLKNKYFAMST